MKTRILIIRKSLILLTLCVNMAMTFVSCNDIHERDELGMEFTSNIFLVKPETAKKLYPTSYNVEMAKEKGLSKNSIYEDKFLLLQSGYRAIFNVFLCNCTNISEYQNNLDINEFNFPQGSRTEYMEIGAFGRNNIYLRNSLYVERLSVEDIELIFNAIDGETIKIDEALLSMVERTWRKIITIHLDTAEISDEPYEIIYDQDGINKISAFNDALVFELAYDIEYDSSNNILNKENEKAKYEYATYLANKMEGEISSALSCHVTVIIKG